MKLPPFRLDQWLSSHEFASPPIRFNLASSTGPAWTYGELRSLGGGQALDDLDVVRLTYAPPQGSALLRERIAGLYGIDPDWVVVTTGAAEGLSVAMCAAAERGASIALPFPAFPAMAAMAQAWGLTVRSYRPQRDEGFAHDAGLVLGAVDDSTRLALVNTPHNPTGAVMDEEETTKLAGALADRNIPLLVDEVYHPLYFGPAVASAAKTPNVIVVSDFSKAFSLSGLRIGWLIDRDAQRREQLIDLRSYFTVSSSPLTEAIAAFALSRSGEVLARLRAVAQANVSALKRFMDAHADTLGWVAPRGGTVSFPWLRAGGDARPLCEALARQGVLLAPGDCFDLPSHFRVGVGAQSGGFEEALGIFDRVLAS